MSTNENFYAGLKKEEDLEHEEYAKIIRERTKRVSERVYHLTKFSAAAGRLSDAANELAILQQYEADLIDIDLDNAHADGVTDLTKLTKVQRAVLDYLFAKDELQSLLNPEQEETER